MATNHTLCANSINTNSLKANNFSDTSSGGIHKWVAGYAPTSFATASTSTVLNLNDAAGLAADASPLKIPKRAFILRVLY